jgi:hypothetical protein
MEWLLDFVLGFNKFIVDYKSIKDLQVFSAIKHYYLVRNY